MHEISWEGYSKKKCFIYFLRFYSRLLILNISILGFPVALRGTRCKIQVIIPMIYDDCQNNFLDRLLVRGNLLSEDQSILPYGSQIIVSVVDASLQDAPSRPINTFVLYGSYQFPISYEIPLTSMINSNQLQRLSIEARIEKDGRLLYINDEYTPVRFSSMPINIRMKNIGNSNGLFRFFDCLVFALSSSIFL